MATIQIINLLEDGCAVVVVDSAGAERTARVCERIQYARNGPSITRVLAQDIARPHAGER
jgi:hypothetical protein